MRKNTQLHILLVVVLGWWLGSSAVVLARSRKTSEPTPAQLRAATDAAACRMGLEARHLVDLIQRGLFDTEDGQKELDEAVDQLDKDTNSYWDAYWLEHPYQRDYD